MRHKGVGVELVFYGIFLMGGCVIHYFKEKILNHFGS